MLVLGSENWNCAVRVRGVWDVLGMRESGQATLCPPAGASVCSWMVPYPVSIPSLYNVHTRVCTETSYPTCCRVPVISIYQSLHQQNPKPLNPKPLNPKPLNPKLSKDRVGSARQSQVDEYRDRPH